MQVYVCLVLVFDRRVTKEFNIIINKTRMVL